MYARHWALAFLENRKFLHAQFNFAGWIQQISATETVRKQGMQSVSRPELDIAVQNIDNATCNNKSSASKVFNEILIIAEITVLREILKYISYDESLPGSMAC